MGVNEYDGSETTPARARLLGTTVGVEEAARLLGIGRTLAYKLAAHGKLPVPVVRIGRSLRVPTAPLRALLGLADVGQSQTSADQREAE